MRELLPEWCGVRTAWVIVALEIRILFAYRRVVGNRSFGDHVRCSDLRGLTAAGPSLRSR